jgi:hypothetical protein
MVGRMAVPEYDSHSVVHPGVASAPSELLLAGEPARRWVGVGHLLPNERDRRIPRHQPTSPAGSTTAPCRGATHPTPYLLRRVSDSPPAFFSHSPPLFARRYALTAGDPRTPPWPATASPMG